jgi:hypothetical protein
VDGTTAVTALNTLSELLDVVDGVLATRGLNTSMENRSDENINRNKNLNMPKTEALTKKINED